MWPNLLTFAEEIINEKFIFVQYWYIENSSISSGSIYFDSTARKVVDSLRINES